MRALLLVVLSLALVSLVISHPTPAPHPESACGQVLRDYIQIQQSSPRKLQPAVDQALSLFKDFATSVLTDVLKKEHLADAVSGAGISSAFTIVKKSIGAAAAEYFKAGWFSSVQPYAFTTLLKSLTFASPLPVYWRGTSWAADDTICQKEFGTNGEKFQLLWQLCQMNSMAMGGMADYPGDAFEKIINDLVKSEGTANDIRTSIKTWYTAVWNKYKGSNKASNIFTPDTLMISFTEELLAYSEVFCTRIKDKTRAVLEGGQPNQFTPYEKSFLSWFPAVLRDVRQIQVVKSLTDDATAANNRNYQIKLRGTWKVRD